MTILQLVAGFALLLLGGEALVKGSVTVARRLGISPMVIGLTLVGFGTSTPELVTSLQAARMGSPGIAIGNVVGSNIANILLILGVSVLILPMGTTRKAFTRDGFTLIASSLLLLAIVWSGSMSRGMGVLCLGLLALYTLYALHTERTTDTPAASLHAAEAAEFADDQPTARSTGLGALLALAGIAGVIWGADLAVGASLVIARSFGISEAVIGLTLVALGTSLPELATSVMAAIRRHGDVAFGNIVGSNVFNILGVAGATAVVSPFAVPAGIAAFDIWVMVGTAFLLVFFSVTGWKVKRWEGAVLLASYIAWLAVHMLWRSTPEAFG